MYGVGQTAGTERLVDNWHLYFSQLNIVFVFIVDVLCFALFFWFVLVLFVFFKTGAYVTQTGLKFTM